MGLWIWQSLHGCVIQSFQIPVLYDSVDFSEILLLWSHAEQVKIQQILQVFNYT